MLTQLATVKNRLAILETDLQYDSILTNTINAVSARFDRECRRTLARTENFTQEFPPELTHISAACYPIETVAKFETKSTEAEGWVEQTGIEYLVRRGCIISLASPLNFQPSTFNPQLARVTYTGGLVLPGTEPPPPVPPATPLPPDLEQAAVEQVAYWFQNRNALGLLTLWPKGGTFERFADPDLLPAVRSVLAAYTRWEY